jgi:hypothetical protein
MLGAPVWLALFVSTATPHAPGGAANSCADPYWQDTLRCRLQPASVPQPAPAPPPTPAQLRKYTRVELADPSVRCVDGTRPIIYVDPAVGGPSNDWIVSTTGGGYCSAEDRDHDGSFESGQECLDAYLEEGGHLMGTAAEPAMSDLADENGSGILTPDPARNPVFARYNRVRIYKCGYDRHSGRSMHAGVAATLPGGAAITYDLYNHGQKIVLETLDTLRGQGSGQGLRYTTWIANGNAVTSVEVQLPSIVDAAHVLFVGHSAAAHGLYENADRNAAYLRAMPGFAGDVRALHDAQFMPSAENEAAFDPAQNPSPATIDTLFDQRTSGTTAASGSYDSYRYHGHPLSTFAADYRSWLESPGDSLATVLDESCVAAHTASNDVWKCVDRLHVRLHHESTPSLSREDFTDPNGDHNNLPFGHVVWWGEFGNYPHCNALFGFMPCVPTLTLQQNTNRLLVQATHFADGYFSRSELATGADASGPPGSVFLWMPRCGFHSGAYDDSQFFGTSIARADGRLWSYRDVVERFVAAPALGVLESYVDGIDGAASECAPLMLRDGFE